MLFALSKSCLYRWSVAYNRRTWACISDFKISYPPSLGLSFPYPFNSNIDITIHFHEKLIGHFRVPSGLRIKTRLSAQLLIWKWFFILIQIKLIFTRKVVNLASFWKWGFLELGGGLLRELLKDQSIFPLVIIWLVLITLLSLMYR